MHTSTFLNTALAAASFFVSAVVATGDYAPFVDGSCVKGKFYCGRDIIRESGSIPLGPKNTDYNPSYIYICSESHLTKSKENRLGYYDTCQDGTVRRTRHFECEVFDGGNKAGCLYDGKRRLVHEDKSVKDEVFRDQSADEDE